jgi:C4-dicarboxylate-specific signal transduction histidine kinase
VRPGSNSIGSWAWNVRTGALFWSAEHFRICGLEPGSVQPSYDTFLALVHPEDRPRVAHCFDEAVRERAEYECRYRVVRPDNSVREVDALGRPVLDEHGETVQLVGTIFDLTEQVHAADNLRRSDEALLAAQSDLARMSRISMMGELSASLAHELNQPLAAILANSDAALRWQRCDPPNLEELALAAERIRRDALRAGAMVERIRSFLQKAGPARRSVHLREAVQEVVDMLSFELQRHQIEMRVLVPETLPPVLAIRVELQQIFVNLFTNAIESLSRAGSGKQRCLSIECSRGVVSDADVVCVVVQDSGAGFDENDQERLFDAFFTTKAEGLGMGLAISRSIVRRHGGELRARNTPEGPRFDFYIPV